jgi:hypothetical protein
VPVVLLARHDPLARRNGRAEAVEQRGLCGEAWVEDLEVTRPRRVRVAPRRGGLTTAPDPPVADPAGPADRTVKPAPTSVSYWETSTH